MVKHITSNSTKYRSTLLSVAIASLLTTSGCTNFSNAFGYKDSVAQQDNYRVTQDALLNPLELPPDFQDPSRNMDANNRCLMGQINHKLTHDIPSYKVDGMRVDSNLAERWLHIDHADANEIWEKSQKFLTSEGFNISEARKDLGFIKTHYLARKEIVPKTEMSFLTRILNSWRAETAQGALDKLTIRIQNDEQGGVNIFFRHNMLIETPDENTTNWRSRPYHPEFEAEMLYQAMVFLGADQDMAKQGIVASAKVLESSLNGEFYGLTLSAGKEQAWQYLLSLADRANFNIQESDVANGIMKLKLPRTAQDEKGFFARLLSRDQSNLPDNITLKLNVETNNQTSLSITAIDDQALTAEQRKQIFQKLGLID